MPDHSGRKPGERVFQALPAPTEESQRRTYFVVVMDLLTVLDLEGIRHGSGT